MVSRVEQAMVLGATEFTRTQWTPLGMLERSSCMNSARELGRSAEDGGMD